MAGRGQVSWLPGIGRPHLPGGSVSSPVAGARCARGLLRPVTVAGPRRLLTGLPLTTDRISATESIRCNPVTTRRDNPLTLRATRAPERPSVALCSPKSKTRSPKRLDWPSISRRWSFRYYADNESPLDCQHVRLRNGHWIGDHRPDGVYPYGNARPLLLWLSGSRHSRYRPHVARAQSLLHRQVELITREPPGSR